MDMSSFVFINLNQSIVARVQYGVIVTELKGAIGGSVFQAGNGSKVLRNKGYRKGTSSSSRRLANSNVSNAAKLWGSITAANRAAWIPLIPTWTFVDKFGATYQGTAYQVFVAYNSLLLSTGQDRKEVPAASGTWDTLTLVSADWPLSTGLYIDWGAATAGSQYLQIFMTAPLTPGRGSNNARYKLISVVDTSLSNKYGFSGSYQSFFGAPPLGSLIYYKLVGIPLLYPRSPQSILGSIIVTA